MAKKTNGGLVYSTDPGLSLKEVFLEPSIAKASQDLRLLLDRKRAGKVVTMVSGFKGPAKDLDDLGKTLKSRCGSGGSVKDGLIYIQGDFRDKLLEFLIAEGYKAKKSGG